MQISFIAAASSIAMQTAADITLDSDTYKTLLESTNAIPWKIDWASKRFRYIGPQIEQVLGWQQESWQTVEDWVMRIHPDEREEIVNFCVSQSLLGKDHEADYRAICANGDYVWIRDVVHVVRLPDGSPEALIGFMFDISERKQTEQQLLDMQKKLEEYSYQDGLTGVANRRMFDQTLENEWIQAKHKKMPLALLLIDVDFFKGFNDHYGHLQGDEILRKTAQLLSAAGLRSKDFFARFGGEEFALILPETDISAALKVAERCRQLIFKAQIANAASSICPVLTISIGVACMQPEGSLDATALIQQADQRLYQAKRNGRNRIEAA